LCVYENVNKTNALTTITTVLVACWTIFKLRQNKTLNTNLPVGKYSFLCPMNNFLTVEKWHCYILLHIFCVFKLETIIASKQPSSARHCDTNYAVYLEQLLTFTFSYKLRIKLFFVRLSKFKRCIWTINDCVFYILLLNEVMCINILCTVLVDFIVQLFSPLSIQTISYVNDYYYI